MHLLQGNMCFWTTNYALIISQQFHDFQEKSMICKRKILFLEKCRFLQFPPFDSQLVALASAQISLHRNEALVVYYISGWAKINVLNFERDSMNLLNVEFVQFLSFSCIFPYFFRSHQKLSIHKQQTSLLHQGLHEWNECKFFCKAKILPFLHCL